MARVAPVVTHLNIKLLRAVGHDHFDHQIIDLLHFDFLLDLDKSNFIPSSRIINHSSSLQFTAEVNNYLREEIKFGTILSQTHRSRICTAVLL
jgi:hypothetical protein